MPGAGCFINQMGLLSFDVCSNLHCILVSAINEKELRTNNQNQLSTYMVLCGLGVHANNFKTTIAVCQRHNARHRTTSVF